MMEGKISLIIKTIFALIVLFLLFPITAHGAIPRDPNLPPDIADSDYYWGSPTTITNIEKGVNFTYHDKGAPDTGWALNTTLYNFYLIKEDNQFKLNGLAVAVLKTNPRSGYFKDKDNPELAIAIKDPFNVAPQPLRSITKGYLWGQIFPINIDQWKSKPEEVIKDGSVDLIYFDPTAGYWVQVTGFATADYRGVDIENKNYVFRRFTVSQANGGKGLLEGRYRLVYSHSEKASRTTGDAKGDFTQWLIGVESLINGEIEFQLDRINDYDARRDNADLRGYGQITYNTGRTGQEAKSPATTTNITSAEKGIYIDVEESTEGKTIGDAVDDVFMTALASGLAAVGDMISVGMKAITGWIDSSIKESSAIDTAVLNNATKNVRNITLSLLTLGLLIIAFANILNIQVAQYGITHMIPKFVMGIVMSYASYFIVMFLLSFTNALQSLMVSAMGINGLSGADLGIESLAGSFDSFINVSLTLEVIRDYFGEVFILLIIGLLLLLVFIWLWIIMIARKAMLMLLVVVAPLAFICMIMPFTEQYYKKWWATFWKWAFIGPAVIFMLFLSKTFLDAWAASGLTTVIMVGSERSADTWIYLAISIVLIFMAASIPLKMGSEIYGKIKDGWNKSGKLPVIGTPKRMLDQRANNIANRRALKTRQMMGRMAQGEGLLGKAGRFATGMTEKEAEARKMELLKSIGESAPKGKEALKAAINSTKVGSLEEQAYILEAANSGYLDATDARQRDAIFKYSNPDPSNKDYIPGLEKIVGKENGDFAVKALGLGDARYAANAAISLSKTSWADRKPAHWQATSASEYATIAGDKSAIDAALKGSPEASEEFAVQMVQTGAIHQVRDNEQSRAIITKAQKRGIFPAQTAPTATTTSAGTRSGFSPDVQKVSDAARAIEEANQAEIERRLNQEQK